MEAVDDSSIRRIRSGKEFGLAQFTLQDLQPADHDVYEDVGGEDGVVVFDSVVVSASEDRGAGAWLQRAPDEPTVDPAVQAAEGGRRKSRGRAKRGRNQRGVGADLSDVESPGSSRGATPTMRAEDETAAKLAAKKRHQQERREKKKTGGVPASQRLKFVQRAGPGVQARHFSAPETMHSAEGYLGRDDKNQQYNIGSGTAEEVLARLRGFGYQDVDLEDVIDNPLYDRFGTIYGVQLGWPKEWDHVWEGVEAAVGALEKALEGLSVPSNRRGDFIAYATGFSWGGGPTHPTNFVHTTREKEALERFFEDVNVRAVMKRADDALRTWFPEHWKSYQAMQREIRVFNPKLTPPVPGSSFAASTVNLGPVTVCWSHRDGRNLGHGLCLIAPGGKFNPAKGGHLVLHEPRLIVKLRPGSLFLFPSACITHQNVPIGEGETRWSLTAYSAGGLWRFIAHGCKTRGAFIKDDPVGAAAHDAAATLRWEDGCKMFKTLEELKAYWSQPS